jgi:pilus assembly protein Flp/PilA
MLIALQQFLADEEGVEAIEYGLIAALIFLVIVGAVAAAATETVSLFSTISTHVGGTAP